MNDYSCRVPKFTLSNGDKIPCIGMGTFGSDRFSPEEVSKAVAGALRSGWRMFDCAACYGNEAQIGGVFQAAFDEGIVKREELYITSKVWNDMHRRVREAALKSINDSRCGYIDLYFIHWPFPNYHAPGCDVDSRNPDSKPFSVNEFVDTYRQIESLVDEKLVRHIGISNMTIPKLEKVIDKLRIKPSACELEMHPCFQQEDLFKWLKAHDIMPVGYMPLGSPRRPERDIVEGDIADLELPEMKVIAEAHHVHPAIIALKWAIQRGQIPIPFSLHNYVSNLRVSGSSSCKSEEREEAEETHVRRIEAVGAGRNIRANMVSP